MFKTNTKFNIKLMVGRVLLFPFFTLPCVNGLEEKTKLRYKCFGERIAKVTSYTLSTISRTGSTGLEHPGMKGTAERH